MLLQLHILGLQVYATTPSSISITRGTRSNYYVFHLGGEHRVAVTSCILTFLAKFHAWKHTKRKKVSLQILGLQARRAEPQLQCKPEAPGKHPQWVDRWQAWKHLHTQPCAQLRARAASYLCTCFSLGTLHPGWQMCPEGLGCLDTHTHTHTHTHTQTHMHRQKDRNTHFWLFIYINMYLFGLRRVGLISQWTVNKIH
jgi:hypothetical protein